MAEASELVSIECGYCLSKYELMVDPRCLPCSHVHCGGCLSKHREEQKTVRCPSCRKVFDVEVASLTPYKPGADNHKCDLCARKDKNEDAVMYCKDCKKLCCTAHQEYHDDFHENHNTIPVIEYKSHVDQLEPNTCAEHEEQAFTLGCGICLNVFCVSCISPLNRCVGDKDHQLSNLKELTNKLTEEIEKLNEAVKKKQVILSALFKMASSVVSEYREETKDMVEKLHKTRDEQIKAIQAEYAKLVEEFLTSRNKTGAEMMSFMEDEVGKKLTILGDQRALMETRLRTNQMAGIVTSFRDTQTRVNELVDRSMPKLVADEVQALAASGAKRDIEMKIVTANSIHIAFELASSLTILKTIETISLVWSLCSYKGTTYIGKQYCSLDAIDKHCNMSSLVSHGLSNSLPGITIYQDKIYVAVFGNPCTINVYSLSGKLLTKWNRKDKCQHIKPAIVSNQLIVPDTNKHRLTVYSLRGEVVKHIDCPLVDGSTRLCAVSERSVVVASSSGVFRMDITEGDIEWAQKDLSEPQASALYRNHMICLACKEKIAFLNVHTGDLLSELATDCSFLDIDIDGSTLAAAVCNEDKVLVYQINQ